MRPKYTQQQYALCLHGLEANDHFGDIAKATGMNILTVATYAQAKNREWLEAKAKGKFVPRKDNLTKKTKIATRSKTVTKVFNTPILNEIFERLTPLQRRHFETAMVDVILRLAFLA